MIVQTKLCIEYAHRFLGHKGEAQYFHGHHGELTIDVEGIQNKRGFVVPVSHIKRIV
jgi:6-pyruvoyltetrahydropterin/6-carboxytetrahydropterin synthase